MRWDFVSAALAMCLFVVCLNCIYDFRYMAPAAVVLIRPSSASASVVVLEQVSAAPKRSTCPMKTNGHLVIPQNVRTQNSNVSPSEGTTNRSVEGHLGATSRDGPRGQQIYRAGVIILGMHRSGTSMLAGLVSQMGLVTGSGLIGGAKDNMKGFFERADVVLQNDQFFNSQNMFFDHNTHCYDALGALGDIALPNLHNGTMFVEGRKSLKFLNNPMNYPYMLKDPRLCITLRTWLPLLDSLPAVLFSFRHPMDVSKSLLERHNWYDYERGLKSWYTYNRMAVQQSADLCRVVTSHHKILKDSVNELKKVYDDLHACGVAVPHPLDEAAISSFLDMNLQHGVLSKEDYACVQPASDMVPSSQLWNVTTAEQLALYRESMRVYCALQDGSALIQSFNWNYSIVD
jgi:hypothetical protein